MTHQMQNPAGANGEACEDTLLASRDTQQVTSAQANNQDLVVGAITKNKREALRVTLKSFADLRQVDVRIFKNVHGVDVGTPQGVTIKPANIRDMIEVLERAEIAAKAEGLV
ncbi:hypothetical protein [Bradyrhizobium sp. OAE829]|uniref:hypothetical protein n=1 Tax=Bradyrhizobium sp. OAE829 TaxID=2663807 RepID=UPI001789460F